MHKDVIILTRSSKYKGYCVAGVDVRTGQWVRFVSNDPATNGALSLKHMQYGSRSICKPLDVVRAGVTGPAPLKYQPENYRIDPESRWKKIGRWTISDVVQIHPPEFYPCLFGNLEPYVNSRELARIGRSLTLIQVSDLTLNRVMNTQEKPKTKASFLYRGQRYRNISVTDPDHYSTPDGSRLPQAYLVVSLPNTPILGDRYYKFIAKIYPF